MTPEECEIQTFSDQTGSSLISYYQLIIADKTATTATSMLDHQDFLYCTRFLYTWWKIEELR